MTDREIVERLIAGDRLAAAAVVASWEAPLLRSARALIGDEALAQDAVQETFLRLLREGERLRQVEALFPWLLHVTRNVCWDIVRKERRMARREAVVAREAAGAVGAGPELPAMLAERLSRVREAVDGLPDPQRAVLRLKMWQGLTYREIGARLGLTETSVNYHLSQAVRAVRARLRAAGLANEEAI